MATSVLAWAQVKIFDKPGHEQACLTLGNGLKYSRCIGADEGAATGTGAQLVNGSVDNINIYNPTQPDWIQSLDLDSAKNTNDGEEIEITDQFGPNVLLVSIPTPGTLLLLGAGLLVLRSMRRRTR